MHIPDGYLSPATSAALYVAVAPFWYVASRKVKRLLTTQMVPVLSIFSAFSFAIMMFNIPLPGGTTGHAVGATILAIVLGPWAAVLGISVALIIQALFFGDGGITSIGANCFNIAVVAPFAGYYLYRLVSAGAPITSSRHAIAAAVASFVALNIAALFTALELGLQPLFFRAADGTPLYNPYGLGVAVPAMMIGHLLIAGPAEAVVTGLVVSYLQKSHQPLLKRAWGGGGGPGPQRRSLRPLWGILIGMAALSPLGLLASGTAWGEWGLEEIKKMVGFVPAGMARLGEIWSAPFPDYRIELLGERGSYILSALVGMAIVAALVWGLSRWLAGREKKPSPPS